MEEETNLTTLYVGNLDYTITEDLLCTLFAGIGPITGCKLIRDASTSDPYAFISFENHLAAAAALLAMNGRNVLGKEIKVNWGVGPTTVPKTDLSEHHHIFVGDLSPDIDTKTLVDAFSPFGEISNCRIVRDPITLKSKGYAFVSFVNKSDAENAITNMNGQWLGCRSIRTNWSAKKYPGSTKDKVKYKPLSYDQIYRQTSQNNTTVYCAGFNDGVTEEIIHNMFSLYGVIENIRCFKDKGYAFIKFETKESAARAIESVHNSEICGETVKCSWGRENACKNWPAYTFVDSWNMEVAEPQPVAVTYPYVYNQPFIQVPVGSWNVIQQMPVDQPPMAFFGTYPFQ